MQIYAFYLGLFISSMLRHIPGMLARWLQVLRPTKCVTNGFPIFFTRYKNSLKLTRGNVYTTPCEPRPTASEIFLKTSFTTFTCLSFPYSSSSSSSSSSLRSRVQQKKKNFLILFLTRDEEIVSRLKSLLDKAYRSMIETSLCAQKR